MGNWEQEEKLRDQGKEETARGGWEADTGNHTRPAELRWAKNNAVCGLNVDELSQLTH